MRLVGPVSWFRPYLPGRPSYLQASTAAAANSDLSPRQLRFYTCECTVWRPFTSISATGAPDPDYWLPQVTALRFKIGPRPSQYELQQFLILEGDNVFTLDVVRFALGVEVRPHDILQVTAGPAALAPGWWRIRGDMQPLTMFAGEQKFIAARLSAPPAGIPA
jgi:hypothetical protein